MNRAFYGRSPGMMMSSVLCEKKVSAVFGTHTHVQTADERLLDQHTAYISDIGMVGSANSVIGMSKEASVKKFLDQMPCRYSPATEPPFIFNGIKLSVDENTGKSVSIERLSYSYDSIEMVR